MNTPEWFLYAVVSVMVLVAWLLISTDTKHHERSIQAVKDGMKTDKFYVPKSDK